jgi:TM2 domain-containing membrane protein YozV
MPLIACPDCSTQVSDAAPACPKCGRPMTSRRTAPIAAQSTWNPGIAAVLSLVIPGAGQMYRGDLGLGFGWFLLVVASYVGGLVFGAAVHVLCVLEAFADLTGKRQALKGMSR